VCSAKTHCSSTESKRRIVDGGSVACDAIKRFFAAVAAAPQRNAATNAAAVNATPMEKRAAYVAERSFEESQLPPELMKEIVELSSEIEQIFQTHRAVYQG
jgi:hypothetical protein